MTDNEYLDENHRRQMVAGMNAARRKEYEDNIQAVIDAITQRRAEEGTQHSRSAMMNARKRSDAREVAAQRIENTARPNTAYMTEGSAGRDPAQDFARNLEKAILKPTMLAAMAPMTTAIPSSAGGKALAGGIGAALGGVGGEDPYVSALSMLHPVPAMAQLIHQMYGKEEPMVPMSEAQAGILTRLAKGKGPAIWATRYDGNDLGRAMAELRRIPSSLDPDQKSIVNAMLRQKDGAVTILTDDAHRPIGAYHVRQTTKDDMVPDSNYISGLMAVEKGHGIGSQAIEDASTNYRDFGGLFGFPTDGAKGFWDKVIKRDPRWKMTTHPEYDIPVVVEPAAEFANGGSVQPSKNNTPPDCVSAIITLLSTEPIHG